MRQSRGPSASLQQSEWRVGCPLTDQTRSAPPQELLCFNKRRKPDRFDPQGGRDGRQGRRDQPQARREGADPLQVEKAVLGHGGHAPAATGMRDENARLERMFPDLALRWLGAAARQCSSPRPALGQHEAVARVLRIAAEPAGSWQEAPACAHRTALGSGSPAEPRYWTATSSSRCSN